MPWHEVIGVVQDVRENGIYKQTPPTVYWPTMSASLNARTGQPNAIRGVSFVFRSDRYGVIAYVISQRRREIGIRAALGAQQGELQRMFVRHGLALAGIGVVAGLGAAAALTRLMSTLLYGVTPLHPVTYLAVPVVLLTATALASYLPARRAASVDPVEALAVE